MEQLGPAVSRHGLAIHGIGNIKCAHWNYSTPALYEEAVRRGEGVLARGGALVVTTGQHTGRSAGDKFIVEDSASAGDIAWGVVNKPISADHCAGLRRKLLAYLQGREIFVQDCYAGAAPAHRLAVRVITESAWHNLFARNMF
ncbi:MAG: phosphoenolpyruvate carboxykinase (ATP), partial [Alphaproteobacteria bacterium]